MVFKDDNLAHWTPLNLILWWNDLPGIKKTLDLTEMHVFFIVIQNAWPSLSYFGAFWTLNVARFGRDAQEIRQARRAEQMCQRICNVWAHGNKFLSLCLGTVTMGKIRISWLIRNKSGDFHYAQQERVKWCQLRVFTQWWMIIRCYLCRRLSLTSRSSPSRPPSSPATPSLRCTAPCWTGTPPLQRGSSPSRSPQELMCPTSPCKSPAGGHLSSKYNPDTDT